MKKISVFIALFISLFSAAYAQETKLNTSPPYDNVNFENLINKEKVPMFKMHNSKYALLEITNYFPNNNRMIFTGNPEIINFSNHTITTFPKQEKLRKLVKTQMLLY